MQSFYQKKYFGTDIFFVDRKHGFVNARRLIESRDDRVCTAQDNLALQSTWLRKGRRLAQLSPYPYQYPAMEGEGGRCTHILYAGWSDFTLDQTYNAKTVSAW
jgi:hypothetical protein